MMIAGVVMANRRRRSSAVPKVPPDFGPPERAQHDELVTEGDAQPHKRVVTQTPLDRYERRRQITREQWTAGDRLRSFLGQALKLAGGDHKRVFDLLTEAQRDAIAEPQAWLVAQLGGKTTPGGRPRNGFVELIESGQV